MMCHTYARFQVIYLLWTSTCSERLIAQNTLCYQARGVSCFISREFSLSAFTRDCALFRFSFQWVVKVGIHGCKELKSACDFGRPEKYCTGPGRSDNEQADLAEVKELTNTESTPPTDEHGAAASSHLLLQSLAASVKLLSSEMKALRQETNELRTFVRAPASEQPASVIPPRVTLPELRAMTDLAKTVDRRVGQLSLPPSDDSGTDDESDNLKQSAVE